MNEPASGPPRTKVKLVAVFVAVIVLPAVFILLLEGGSSLCLLALTLWRGEQAQLSRFEGWHVGYDAELGWVGLHNVSILNMYGSGVGVHTDAHGFRVTRSVAAQSAAAKLPVICSGDSFTFGDGVADDETWCARLAALDSRLATVNMGLSAYGVDQAYLWYKRDGGQLEHGIHLFTYITHDLIRMQLKSFGGHAKPVLAIRNDSLIVENTPVPCWEVRARWFNTTLVLRKEMRLARFLALIRDSVFHGQGRSRWNSAPSSDEDSLLWLKLRRVTEDLARIDREKGGTLVLVHLPVITDYWTSQSDPWRTRMEAASARGEFVFVDLVRELRRLPADSVEDLFIGHDFPGYADALEHYSVAGHQWVAEQIYHRLLEFPTIAARLGRLATPTSSVGEILIPTRTGVPVGRRVGGARNPGNKSELVSVEPYVHERDPSAGGEPPSTKAHPVKVGSQRSRPADQVRSVDSEGTSEPTHP